MAFISFSKQFLAPLCHKDPESLLSRTKSTLCFPMNSVQKRHQDCGARTPRGLGMVREQGWRPGPQAWGPIARQKHWKIASPATALLCFQGSGSGSNQLPSTPAWRRRKNSDAGLTQAKCKANSSRQQVPVPLVDQALGERKLDSI